MDGALRPWLLQRHRKAAWPAGWLNAHPLHLGELHLAEQLKALDEAEHAALGHVLPDWARLDCALLTGLNVGWARLEPQSQTWHVQSWLAAIPMFGQADMLIHRFMAKEGNHQLLAATLALLDELEISRWQAVLDLRAPGLNVLLEQGPRLLQEVLPSTPERAAAVVLRSYPPAPSLNQVLLPACPLAAHQRLRLEPDLNQLSWLSQQGEQRFIGRAL